MPEDPKRLLITAGPTHEPIDAVRYIANRSSGKLGIALAEAGRDAGFIVTLLLGPWDVSPPQAVAVHRFETSSQLESLLDAHFGGCDILIMAAAVADFRPASTYRGKLERGARMTLELEPTPDLLARCAARKCPGQTLVGFALEDPENLESRALQKLRKKGLDAIVANPLPTMGSESIHARLITDQCVTDPGPMSKRDFARWLIDHLPTRRA